MWTGFESETVEMKIRSDSLASTALTTKRRRCVSSG